MILIVDLSKRVWHIFQTQLNRHLTNQIKIKGMAKTFNQYEKNILLYWLEQREKSSVAAKWFSAENQFFFGLLNL